MGPDVECAPGHFVTRNTWLLRNAERVWGLAHVEAPFYRELLQRSCDALAALPCERTTAYDGAHSVFATALMRALQDNDGVIEGQLLFERIKRRVVLNADQTPQDSDIRRAGHDGGDFLFVRRRRILRVDREILREGRGRARWVRMAVPGHDRAYTA